MTRILLSTPVFKPMVGGMETMAHNLAEHFTNRGFLVTLVTPIAASEPDDAPYEIVRQPSPSKFYQLVKRSEVVFCNGASLFAAPYTILANTPVIVRHTNYVVSSIDGAGWYDGRPAPLRPAASILHHLRHGNFWNTLRGALKIAALRLYVTRFVTKNVAISDWMLHRHPLPNQVRIHNPFPISKFVGAENITGDYDYDFFFLGRLITEKGVDTLLQAFEILQQRAQGRYRLLIIGDGPDRDRLEAIAERTGQADRITFAGMRTGQSLLDHIRSARIAVLPSIWEEPFGGASTELMAAGKNLIVSRDGALSEIVADGGLSFPNGDAASLASAMDRLITDPNLQSTQLAAAQRRLAAFDENRLIDAYIDVIDEVVGKEI